MANFLSSHALAGEWHPARNGLVTPEHVTLGSNKKVWWLGECGHEWEAVVANRVNGNSCPFCSHRMVLPGFNDLASINSQLATEWHPTRNNVEAWEVMPNSNSKAWWVCEENHEWEAKISNRNKLGRGCPYCVGQKSLSGFNDLLTVSPEIAVEWHPIKNVDVSVENVTAGSKLKVWWLGECGHEWEESIQNRVRKKYGCPFCSNHKILTGFNDLLSVNPDLAAEWHPDLNLSLTAEMVSVGSDQKVWWLGVCGHEWEAVVYSRRHNGCPVCATKAFISKAEQEIFIFLNQFGFDVKQSDRLLLKGSELDIYVPEKKVAVEFNGLYWHSEAAGKTKNYHYNKWLACKEQGIQLIQVWEDDWNRNPGLIKQMLAHKLGVAGGDKVYARNTTVRELSLPASNRFLNAHHIQGGAIGSKYLGLFTQSGELAAVMVVKIGHSGEDCQIVRYATDRQVVGGFTKLLKHVERTGAYKTVSTFSDNMVSTGKLYESNGFEVVKNLEPDYFYIVNRVRKHKFGYRLKKFKNDPDLVFVTGLTETELAELNGLPRIWDAGKIKWVKVL